MWELPTAGRRKGAPKVMSVSGERSKSRGSTEVPSENDFQIPTVSSQCHDEFYPSLMSLHENSLRKC